MGAEGGSAGLSVLALAALVRHASPRPAGSTRAAAAAFVALNPLVLVHVVGGAHNDALMMLLAMCRLRRAARAARAGRRRRRFVAAAAVKVSAAFVAPVRAGRARAAGGVSLAGALAAAGADRGGGLLAFGGQRLDAFGLAGENQARTSHYSVPATRRGSSASTSDAAADRWRSSSRRVVAWLSRWIWRGGDWLRAAGWAALGLLLASGWLLPWYVIWVLPLAALARDRALSRAGPRLHRVPADQPGPALARRARGGGRPGGRRAAER